MKYGIMDTVFLVAGMAAVTFLLRYLLLPLSDKLTLSNGMRRALRYVPPVVLTAIIVPAVLIPDGQSYHVSWQNPYLVGAVVTAIIGKVTKNLLITIIAGMAFFALWQWLVQIWCG
jgi:branched-subunit amino acid transport protein